MGIGGKVKGTLLVETCLARVVNSFGATTEIAVVRQQLYNDFFHYLLRLNI
jgi:hypothetical protein